MHRRKRRDFDAPPPNPKHLIPSKSPVRINTDSAAECRTLAAETGTTDTPVGTPVSRDQSGPTTAAQGDDDLMSQAQTVPVCSPDV